MVAPALIGAGISAVGNIFGGKARKKAAKQAAQKMEEGTNAAIYETMRDQERAAALHADDEARLRAATGFDLVKLVADAELSGFNPLTVLNATGGAGYDGRGAVMTSPFIGRADAVMQKASMMGGANQAVASTAGYFGDAMSGLGNAFFDLSRDAAQRNHEMSMLMAERAPVVAPKRAAGGFAPNRQITASPVKSTYSRGAGGVSVGKVGRSKLYDGLDTVTTDETRAPMTGYMIDPLFGAEWLIGNPDLDNEPLNAAMLATLPGQAGYKGGEWMAAGGGSASRPRAGNYPKPGPFMGFEKGPNGWAPIQRSPFRTPNRAAVFNK